MQRLPSRKLRQPKEWEKIFLNHTSDDTFLEYMINCYNSVIKIPNILIKNGQRICTDISPKNIYTDSQ